MTLKAYSFFHLNLAYSAISEERRLEVVEKCYWPLLRLAEKHDLPFGIEASAWTLETINTIDPRWIVELKRLVTEGPCEFIGSGYAQIIGPLVPAEVNAENLQIGMRRYQELLGLLPEVALINEQAYSAGIVPLYREAGFKAIIMEWDNPARANPDWKAEWRYFPQYAVGADGAQFPLIWNKSVAFQKVQRFVHGEIELDEYLNYFKTHQAETTRAFPVYGNDVEVFDFRPGRYMTEAPLERESEWAKLESLYLTLQKTPGIELVRPSRVLTLLTEPGAGNALRLETTEYPIPVKKQEKYNVLRWAVSGRDDLGINTKCWQIYEILLESAETTEEDWTELCYLWGSDFRTHITEQRWLGYTSRLDKMLERCSAQRLTEPAGVVKTQSVTRLSQTGLIAEHNGRFIDVCGERLCLRFNTYRGLCLESFGDSYVGDVSLFGTLPHGFFDDIKWAADFYSGHLVFESAATSKVTDLNRVKPKINWADGFVSLSTDTVTSFGKVCKTWLIDDLGGEVSLSFDIDWPLAPRGSLRLGFITLNPAAFDYKSLTVRAANGGAIEEVYPLFNRKVDHGAPVSFLISANQALSLSNGMCRISDAKRYLALEIDKSASAAVAMIKSQRIKSSYLTRIYFSILEQDDTSRPRIGIRENFKLVIRSSKAT
jgi:hypothetical protein